MIKFTPPTLLCDFYKVSLREQYPDKTEMIYSTWTPRSNKHAPKQCETVVAFGFQGFIKKYLIDYFDTHFFSRSESEIRREYYRYIKYALMVENPQCDHIVALHRLGYLPLEIKALPEGTNVPMRVPMLTMRNTHKDFFWLTNYFETPMSCEMWLPSTSATLAQAYRKILNKYALKTNGSTDLVQFQGHDFSMRGMGCVESAQSSGAGHLLSFSGTDTIPAISYLEQYYNADIEKELVGTSIPATEHSVMCAGGRGNEGYTYERLITDIYPTGFVSIVSDTWNLWHTLTYILPKLKDQIMARDGKVVIRPDSGDPVDIICGCKWNKNTADRESMSPQSKGVVELLWDTFGGTVNSKGYKELDSHIGCIYGDAITLERCEEICRRLEAKGFASTNMVYGIGSYTYQYNTRDTFGFALKSTMCIIDGKENMIFKDPITDDGTKKSQTGCVVVTMMDNKLECVDGLNLAATNDPVNQMRTIFKDGKMIVDDDLTSIRKRMEV